MGVGSMTASTDRAGPADDEATDARSVSASTVEFPRSRRQDRRRRGEGRRGWDAFGGGLVAAVPARLGELPDAVGHQRVVNIAVGILIAQRGCSPSRAEEILIDLATRTDRSVVEEARRLVARHTRADRGGPPTADDETGAPDDAGVPDNAGVPDAVQVPGEAPSAQEESVSSALPR